MPSFEDALAALESGHVLHCVRKRGREVSELGSCDDLDVLVRSTDLRAAERLLHRAGFRHLRAHGHGGHRFHVAFDERTGQWRKVDLVSCLRYGTERVDVEGVLRRRRRVDGIWVASLDDEREHARRRDDGQREPRTLARRLARRLPLSARRAGPVIAFLGPDGAGKGSVLEGVTAALPVGARAVYLGNLPRSTPAAAPPATAPEAPAPEAAAAAAAAAPSAVREAAFLLRKAGRMWPRLAGAYAAAWRGNVVLCDRHPREVLAIAPQRTAPGALLERLLFVHLVPKPDTVVVLDAPGAELYRRKGEHDPELLERWRQAYLRTFIPPGVVIPTTGSVETSVERALEVVWQQLQRRRRWSSEVELRTTS